MEKITEFDIRDIMNRFASIISSKELKPYEYMSIHLLNGYDRERTEYYPKIGYINRDSFTFDPTVAHVIATKACIDMLKTKKEFNDKSDITEAIKKHGEEKYVIIESRQETFNGLIILNNDLYWLYSRFPYLSSIGSALDNYKAGNSESESLRRE